MMHVSMMHVSMMHVSRMHVCMIHISTILDPDTCVYDACMYDLQPLALYGAKCNHRKSIKSQAPGCHSHILTVMGHACHQHHQASQHEVIHNIQIYNSSQL